MSRGQYRVALAILALAGLLGGMLGSLVLGGCALRAQEGPAASPGDTIPAEPEVPAEIRAQRFVVVDKEGRERAALGPRGLVLSDAAGKSRALLHVYPDGAASLTLLPAAGKSWVRLENDADGTSSLMLRDDAGQLRVTLESDAHGTSSLMLRDDAGALRALLQAHEDHGPGLVLADAASQDRVVLGSTETVVFASGVTQKHPLSTITLFGETGRVLWQAPPR